MSGLDLFDSKIDGDRSVGSGGRAFRYRAGSASGFGEDAR